VTHNWFLAYLWWLIWGFGRWLWKADDHSSWQWYWRSGRQTSWYPVRCAACGWRGPERWAEHNYAGESHSEDVEPTDYCPRCGTEVM
jgi:hypothetical protein